MGFGGFIVSDWNAHGQVAGCTNASCPQAINAGLDMYMAPDTWKPFAKSGADVARLDSVFELSTDGKIDVSISKVELGTVADEVLGC